MLVSQRKMKQIGFFAFCVLLIFAFYETVVKMDNVPRQNPRSRLMSNIEDRPSQERLDNYEDSSIAKNQVNDLVEAKKRIHELAEKLHNIEAKVNDRIPKKFPTVKFLNYKNRKRILVTGGAGFVGSHLVDRLMLEGHEIIVADNFFTGRKRNVEHWVGHENFELVHHDIVRPLYLEVDEIYHLASPASPPHYMLNPVKTLKTNTIGTINMLGIFVLLLL
ncbi:UDP-glucuronic acid decarboxylase 1-like [Diachasma alloeum]|uniref:UDP-glucuronic acid decarboxylase 1-like n=1 Tax=Diachasma alloeum TaxID=454923 RepID=UPI00073821B1|nr:UDP-glucuronic acid decarboxylase 1-like [Diachasma alloeum]